jgi:hypothetical protein
VTPAELDAVTLADARADAEELAALPAGPFASDDDVLVVRGRRIYVHHDEHHRIWMAYEEGYDASFEECEDGVWRGDPVGQGATLEAAIADLLEQLDEEAP